MRVLIVGLGSIGSRHLDNLRVIDRSVHVTVWHQHRKPGDGGHGGPAADCTVYRLEDAIQTKPDAALITGPASRHVEAGLALAEAGMHLFIEKPISDTLNKVDELLRLCRERDLVLMVGYNFVFYRPFQIMQQAIMEGRIGRVLSVRAEVGQFLPEWRPASDYRQTVSAKFQLGGGVLLELSHEFEYVRRLVGEVKAVSAELGHLSDLEIDVEDTAEVILRFTNGAIGSVHVDMTQRPARRICHVVGTQGTLAWDGSTHRVGLFSAAANTWSELHPGGSIDLNETYMEEMRHFLDCVRRREPPKIGGEDARRILEIVLAAKRSHQEQQVVEV